MSGSCSLESLTCQFIILRDSHYITLRWDKPSQQVASRYGWKPNQTAILPVKTGCEV